MTEALTTGFNLSDDDQGDFFSVDIKTDPVYNTPVFDLVSGRSSCPYEPGTQPRDGAQLEVDNLVQTNVPPDDPAIFQLFLGNTSQSEEARVYLLKFNDGSNPDGATIEVGGTPYDSPRGPFTIPSGSPLQQTVRVYRKPPAYDFPNLEFSLVSICDTSISNSIRLSAYFQSDCSPISMQTDEAEWIVNARR